MASHKTGRVGNIPSKLNNIPDYNQMNESNLYEILQHSNERAIIEKLGAMFNLGNGYMLVSLCGHLYIYILELYYLIVWILKQINYVMIYKGLVNAILIDRFLDKKEEY